MLCGFYLKINRKKEWESGWQVRTPQNTAWSPLQYKVLLGLTPCKPVIDKQCPGLRAGCFIPSPMSAHASLGSQFWPCLPHRSIVMIQCIDRWERAWCPTKYCSVWRIIGGDIYDQAELLTRQFSLPYSFLTWQPISIPVTRYFEEAILRSFPSFQGLPKIWSFFLMSN